MSTHAKASAAMVAASLVLAGCGDRVEVAEPPTRVKVTGAPADDVAKLVAANNAFANDLFSRLRRSEGNIAFSPYSVHTALALTSSGAHGETLEQMKSVLHLSTTGDSLHRASATLLDKLSGPDSATGLRIANAIWADKTCAVRAAFIETARNHYLAPVTLVDFVGGSTTTADAINTWTRDRTGGLIPRVIGADDLSSMTRLVITNALYFQEKWLHEFMTHQTYPDSFFLRSDQMVTVPMMNMEQDLLFAQAGDVKLVRLPFNDRRFSMVFVLPRERFGLAAAEGQVTLSGLSELVGSATRKTMTLRLPRVKLDVPTRLKEVLIELGMPSPFDAMKANLSGLADEKDELYLSNLHHRAAAEINEAGAKVAAATAVPVPSKDGPPQEFDVTRFIADEPFLILLRHDETGLILFAGRVSDPRGQ